MYNDRVSFARFAKQADGTWVTGLNAKASHDVELKWDTSYILWSLETA